MRARTIGTVVNHYLCFRNRKSMHLKIQVPVLVKTLSRTDFHRIHSRVVSIVDLMLDLDLMIPSETASLTETMHSVLQVAIHLVINAVEFQQSHQM